MGVQGCSPAYVARAGYEQARILWAREPIERILAAPNVDRRERDRMELVLDVRRFAAESLGLRVAGNYTSLVRIDDRAVMHVVTAAERFRLQPYTWWFPIVGRVPYKGYFDRAHALAEASHLEDRGFDTNVLTAAAFSTLGWFDDPLMSSHLALDPPALVNLILHELLHSTHYAAGDAAFSESFATFVGYRGAIAYFQAHQDTGTAAAVEREWGAVMEFSDFLGRELSALEGAYAAGITASERDTMFAGIRDRWDAVPASALYPGLGQRPLNNAVLLHLRVYHRELRLFETLWETRGRDARSTIQSIITATSRRGDPFTSVRQLLPADTNTAS